MFEFVPGKPTALEAFCHSIPPNIFLSILTGPRELLSFLELLNALERH